MTKLLGTRGGAAPFDSNGFAQRLDFSDTASRWSVTEPTELRQVKAASAESSSMLILHQHCRSRHMNSIDRSLCTGTLIAAMSFAAHAQGMSGHGHHAAAPAAGPAALERAEMSEGEVSKVDSEKRRITLKHGPLKNLGMPSMTMAFEVADAAMLRKVAVGDKVHFVAENPGGKLTLTQIQVAR